MADEVRVSSQGPDGNGVQVDLREKKFALTGPNVALLLLICIIGAVAWLRTGTIDKTLKSGQEQLRPLRAAYNNLSRSCLDASTSSSMISKRKICC